MKTIFIGECGKDNPPNNGVSIKNFHILQKLKEYVPEIKVVNADRYKLYTLNLFFVILTILLNRQAKFILSLNSEYAYRIIKIINKLAPKATVVYWVIGGVLGEWMLQNKVLPSAYKNIKNIIVEGESMKRQMEQCGLNNVSVMPNFKKIIPIELSHSSRTIQPKFIFLSRILPEKGADLILEATQLLNNKGKKFSVDFYGPIEDSYKTIFLEKISALKNVSYRGFIDLRDTSNYKKLSDFDAFLFPTYWNGEGCPGAIIDAFMLGLPVLASDWHLNKDIVEDGVNGFIFESKSVNALKKAMEKIITRQEDLLTMRKSALEKAKEFDIDYCLSRVNLSAHNII